MRTAIVLRWLESCLVNPSWFLGDSGERSRRSWLPAAGLDARAVRRGLFSATASRDPAPDWRGVPLAAVPPAHDRQARPVAAQPPGTCHRDRPGLCRWRSHALHGSPRAAGDAGAHRRGEDDIRRGPFLVQATDVASVQQLLRWSSVFTIWRTVTRYCCGGSRSRPLARC